MPIVTLPVGRSLTLFTGVVSVLVAKDSTSIASSPSDVVRISVYVTFVLIFVPTSNWLRA